MTISGSAIPWTGRSRLDPSARGGDELLMRQRGQGARSTVDPTAGLEGPTDEGLFFVVFQEPRSIEVVVFRAICNGPADLGAGQDLPARVLPPHRQRRQVPAMPARYAGAFGVGLLVTGHALQRRNTLALGPAHDVGEVAMPIVALLRVVRGSVAVDAAGRRQHGVDLLPRGETLRGFGGRFARNGIACRAERG